MTQTKYLSFFLTILAAAAAMFLPSLSSAQFAARTHSAFYETSATPLPTVYTPEESPGFWLGVVGGINVNSYQAGTFSYSFSLPANQSFLASEHGQWGAASFFGITCEIPADYTNHMKIIEEFLYDSKSASFNSGSFDNVDLAKFGSQGKGHVSTDLHASLTYILVCGGYKYNFIAGPEPNGPGIQLEVVSGLNIVQNITEGISANDSLNNEFYESSQSHQVNNIFKIRLGLRGQFSYDIPLAEKFLISPLAGYDFPITKVDDTEKSWKASSIFAGIALRFKI